MGTEDQTEGLSCRHIFKEILLHSHTSANMNRSSRISVLSVLLAITCLASIHLPHVDAAPNNIQVYWDRDLETGSDGFLPLKTPIADERTHLRSASPDQRRQLYFSWSTFMSKSSHAIHIISAPIWYLPRCHTCY